MGQNSTGVSLCGLLSHASPRPTVSFPLKEPNPETETKQMFFCESELYSSVHQSQMLLHWNRSEYAIKTTEEVAAVHGSKLY
uniref:Putative secreted protein n=1 Tax=Ixodes ricinus TaxID=34613 RepID=A0A6B0U7C6_IXORI